MKTSLHASLEKNYSLAVEHCTMSVRILIDFISALDLFLYVEMDFPCREYYEFSVNVCESNIQWRWSGGEKGYSPSKPYEPAPAVHCSKTLSKPDKKCDIEYPAIECHKAKYKTCPNSGLQALVNAWIKLRKIARNQK